MLKSISQYFSSRKQTAKYIELNRIIKRLQFLLAVALSPLFHSSLMADKNVGGSRRKRLKSVICQ